MPSTYTPRLRLTLPATGELINTWGGTVNTGITELVDVAIAGSATLSTWGGAGVAYTLSNNNGVADEARSMFLLATGSPGENKNIICPAVTKLYVVRNSVSGGYSVTLKTAAGTGITVPNGKTLVLWCDGTNVVEAINYLGSLSLVSPLGVESGGTGVSTLTGIVKGNGTSAFSAAVAGTDYPGLATNNTFTNEQVINLNTSGPALKIVQNGAGDAFSVEDVAAPGTTPFIINSVGRVLIGHNVSLASTSGVLSRLQLNSATSNNGSSISMTDWQTGSFAGPILNLQKSKSGAIGTRTAVVDNDRLASIVFGGDDGTNFVEAAAIRCNVDGSVSSGSVPGDIIFATTAQGNSTSTTRVTIASSGEVYIAGTADQGPYNLQCFNTGIWGAGAYVNGSDERLKDNIQTLNDGLSVVNKLRPITFQYKPEYSKDQNVQPGFIAQELKQAMADKNYVNGIVQSGPEYLNVAYQSIIPILTKAIQEQQLLIDSLQARVAALESV